MKKGLLTLTILLAANIACAEYSRPVKDYPRHLSVAEAKLMSDDAIVSLDGFITGHLREEYYLFRDDSGEIAIELEPNIWDEKRIGSDTEIRIHGEVERESGFVYIEVYRLDVDDRYLYR